MSKPQSDYRKRIVNVVHSGSVISKNDGDKHYIGFVKLCQLFGLNPGTAIDAKNPASLGLRNDDTTEIRHYSPSYSGNYTVENYHSY